MNQGTNPMNLARTATRAFTLVEILIVVVILGILAAIVVASMGNSTQEAAVGTTIHELHKLERAIEVYQARHENLLPSVEAGEGTWGELIGREYLKEAPLNPYVGGANAKVIVIADAPDAAYQTSHGWVYSATTGEVWAGGFDADDNPLPRP